MPRTVRTIGLASLVAFFSTVLCPAIVSAQEFVDAVVGQQAIRLAPAMQAVPAGPENNFQLRLVKIKLDDHEDGPRFICMIDRMVKEEQEVRVTVMKQEKKEQTYTVTVNGKEETKTREVNVMVPVTQKVKRQVEVPRGKRPLIVPFSDARLYRLDGTLLSAEEAAKALPTLKTVIVTRLQGRDTEPAAKLLGDVLDADTLFFDSDVLNEALQPLRFRVGQPIPANVLQLPPAVPVELEPAVQIK